MQLSSLVDEYVLFRALSKNSEYQLRNSVRLFELQLRRAASLDDLSDRSVSLCLVYAEQSQSPRSVANLRTNLLCLWRFACDRQLVAPPNRVRKATRPDPCPIAWTLGELRKILQQCESLRGVFRNSVSRPLYCSTLVRFCYESGLRRSDVWRIERVQIRPDGSIVLRQHKTKRTHTPRIRLDTLAGINRLPGDPPLRCPFASTGDWYQFWRVEVIDPAAVRHGALQQIRRTGASWLAVDHPDAVQRYLGHRTPSMQRYYVDESIARPQQYLPPEIVDTEA